MPKDFDIQLTQSRWSREACNQWLRLKNPADKANVSEAVCWIFYNIIKGVDPSKIIGQSVFGGVIYEVDAFSRPPYYCGFRWKCERVEVICYVKTTQNRFIIESVYENGTPDPDQIMGEARGGQSR